MHIIGLTGGIATGKTLVANWLVKTYGCLLLDADQIVQQLTQPGEPGWTGMIKLFGPHWLDASGHLQRNAFADYIFANPPARQQLESLLHPLVRDTINEKIRQNQHQQYIIVCAALLLEAGWHFDPLIILLSQPELQLQRLQQQRGLSYNQAQQRLNAQWDNQQRLAVTGAHFLWNNGSPEELLHRLSPLWHDIIKSPRN